MALILNEKERKEISKYPLHSPISSNTRGRINIVLVFIVGGDQFHYRRPLSKHWYNVKFQYICNRV